MILTFEEGEEELLERVMSVLPFPSKILECKPQNNRAINISGLSIDPEEHMVKYKEKEIFLTKTEYGILEYMAERPGQTFSHMQIYEAVCPGEAEDIHNAVQCLICALRQKLRDYAHKEYIQTVRGVGYKFIAPEHECFSDVKGVLF